MSTSTSSSTSSSSTNSTTSINSTTSDLISQLKPALLILSDKIDEKKFVGLLIIIKILNNYYKKNNDDERDRKIEKEEEDNKEEVNKEEVNKEEENKEDTILFDYSILDSIYSSCTFIFLKRLLLTSQSDISEISYKLAINLISILCNSKNVKLDLINNNIKIIIEDIFYNTNDNDVLIDSLNALIHLDNNFTIEKDSKRIKYLNKLLDTKPSINLIKSIIPHLNSILVRRESNLSEFLKHIPLILRISSCFVNNPDCFDLLKLLTWILTRDTFILCDYITSLLDIQTLSNIPVEFLLMRPYFTSLLASKKAIIDIKQAAICSAAIIWHNYPNWIGEHLNSKNLSIGNGESLVSVLSTFAVIEIRSILESNLISIEFTNNLTYCFQIIDDTISCLLSAQVTDENIDDYNPSSQIAITFTSYKLLTSLSSQFNELSGSLASFLCDCKNDNTSKELPIVWASWKTLSSILCDDSLQDQEDKAEDIAGWLISTSKDEYFDLLLNFFLSFPDRIPESSNLLSRVWDRFVFHMALGYSNITSICIQLLYVMLMSNSFYFKALPLTDCINFLVTLNFEFDTDSSTTNCAIVAVTFKFVSYLEESSKDGPIAILDGDYLNRVYEFLSHANHLWNQSPLFYIACLKGLRFAPRSDQLDSILISLAKLIQSFEFLSYVTNPNKDKNYESDDEADDDTLDDKLELMQNTEMLVKYNKSDSKEFRLKWKGLKFGKSPYLSEFCNKINILLETKE